MVLALTASSVGVLDAARGEMTRAGGMLEFYMKKGVSKHDACATVELRVDPEDGQVWSWNAFLSHFETKYTRAEVNEYWQMMEVSGTEDSSRVSPVSVSKSHVAGA